MVSCRNTEETLLNQYSHLTWQPSWEIADPILSLLGACVILLSTVSVLRDSMNILLEGNTKINFHFNSIFLETLNSYK